MFGTLTLMTMMKPLLNHCICSHGVHNYVEWHHYSNDVYYEVMIRLNFKGLELFAYRLGNYMGL